MEPIPARRTAAFGAFPVQHLPASVGCDADVPRGKIAVPERLAEGSREQAAARGHCCHHIGQRLDRVCLHGLAAHPAREDFGKRCVVRRLGRPPSGKRRRKRSSPLAVPHCNEPRCLAWRSGEKLTLAADQLARRSAQPSFDHGDRRACFVENEKRVPPPRRTRITGQNGEPFRPAAAPLDEGEKRIILRDAKALRARPADAQRQAEHIAEHTSFACLRGIK